MKKNLGVIDTLKRIKTTINKLNSMKKKINKKKPCDIRKISTTKKYLLNLYEVHYI